MATKIWIALIVLCSGCYFQYPKARRTRTPVAAAGTQIEVESRLVTGYRECRNSVEGCVVRGGKLKRPYKYRSTKFTYDGKRLSQGELRALTQPELHDQKYKEIESRKGTCNLSLIPSVVYMAGVIAVLGAAIAKDQLGDSQKYVLIGGAGTAVLGAAVSYPMGGHACGKARDLAAASGINDDGSTDYVADLDDERALERIRVTEEAVEAFNRRQAALPETTPPAEDDAPSVEPPATEPSDPPAPAEGHGVREALVADGRFKTFVRLFDSLEVATKIDASEDFTVFAPTDAAFAKLPADQIARLLAAHGNKDKKRAQKFMLRHFSRYAKTYAELASKTSLPTRYGTVDIEKQDDKLVVAGAVVSKEPITATNSMIYAIDRMLEK